MFQKRRDTILHCGLTLTAILSGSVILAVVAFLLREAWPVVESGTLRSFFSDSEWRPGSEREPQFGIAPMLAASFLVTLLASMLAIPLGVMGAVFQHFYSSPFFAKVHDRLLELLAGIPSVIFGFWGLTVLVPKINQWHPPGQSLFAAGLVLTIMILPTVGLTARSAIRAVEPSLFQSAATLGLSRPTTILKLALPAASKGIAAGCLLAITRALGETLAVVMVCGNIPQIPSSLFDPVRPVTATIALEMGYASSEHKALLYAAGLVLVLITGFLLSWQFFGRSCKSSPAYQGGVS